MSISAYLADNFWQNRLSKIYTNCSALSASNTLAQISPCFWAQSHSQPIYMLAIIDKWMTLQRNQTLQSNSLQLFKGRNDGMAQQIQ
jgi:hypothetical protein